MPAVIFVGPSSLYFYDFLYYNITLLYTSVFQTSPLGPPPQTVHEFLQSWEGDKSWTIWGSLRTGLKYTALYYSITVFSVLQHYCILYTAVFLSILVGFPFGLIETFCSSKIC